MSRPTAPFGPGATLALGVCLLALAAAVPLSFGTLLGEVGVLRIAVPLLGGALVPAMAVVATSGASTSR